MPNAKPWVDDELRAQYRAENPVCEIARHVSLDDPTWRKHLRAWGHAPRTADVRRLETGHVHHVWHCGQRWDHTSNLVGLSVVAHDWCHAYTAAGRLVCTWAKARKAVETGDDAEFDLAALRKIAGFDVVARVLSYEFDAEWLAELQDDLAETF